MISCTLLLLLAVSDCSASQPQDCPYGGGGSCSFSGNKDPTCTSDCTYRPAGWCQCTGQPCGAGVPMCDDGGHCMNCLYSSDGGFGCNQTGRCPPPPPPPLKDLGEICTDGSYCASGFCSGAYPSAGGCVAASGSLGLAGYNCIGPDGPDTGNSLCSSGQCVNPGICQGSGNNRSALIQDGGYCSTDPSEAVAITPQEANTQCASGVCNSTAKRCTPSPTAVPSLAPTPTKTAPVPASSPPSSSSPRITDTTIAIIVVVAALLLLVAYFFVARHYRAQGAADTAAGDAATLKMMLGEPLISGNGGDGDVEMGQMGDASRNLQVSRDSLTEQTTSNLSAAPTALALDHRGTLSRKIQGNIFGSGWSDVACAWSADGKVLTVTEGSSAAVVLQIGRWFQFPPREHKKKHRFDLLMTDGQVESFAAPTETDFDEWVSCLEGSAPAANLSEHPNYTPEWDLGNLNLQYKTLTAKLEKSKTQNKFELAVKLQQQLHALTKTKDKAEKLHKEITELTTSASFDCLENSKQKARELSDLVAGTRQRVSVKFGTAAWIKRMSKFEISYADIELSTQELGKGASSVVMKGKCLGVDVAIKQLTPGNTNAEKKRVQKMLQKETKALERLNHPNVVSMLHVSIDDSENPCIVLELAEKGSVWKVLQEDPTIPQWQRVKFVRDIANGMSIVHRRNLVHHDLKPDNCLVTNEMVVKVSDLGTATGTSATFRGTASPTTSNSVGGTLNYSAPEVLNQTEELRDNPSVDTYAFGITMLEIMTGERVWAGKRPTDINALLLKNRRPDIPESLPSVLKDLIKRCWATDPASRPTFTEISLGLAQLQTKDGFQPPSSAVHVEVMTIVVSTAAIGLGGERIMEYVEAMYKVHKGLVLGYDWADSSSADERDSTSIDWKDSTSVAKSFWFKGYCERVKGQLLLMAQLPFTRVEVVCIKGGPISQLEAHSMSKLTTDVQNDLATKGLQAQLDVSTISFAEFKHRFNAGEVTELLQSGIVNTRV